jgi:hypothetical protein
MRLYTVEPASVRGAMHVVGEVVIFEEDWAEHLTRHTSRTNLPNMVLGMNTMKAMTREELQETKDGRRALLAWDARDDSTFMRFEEARRYERDREEFLEFLAEGHQGASDLVRQGRDQDPAALRRYVMEHICDRCGGTRLHAV